MPVFTVDETPLAPGFGKRIDTSDKPEVDVGALEVFKAAFRTENTLGSLLSRNVTRSKYNEDYDPYDHIDGYENYATRFKDANSAEDVQSIKNQIGREQEDKELIRSSGSTGVIASLTAGVFDPINLIPVGGSAYKAYSVGGSILKGAASTARAGLIGATVAEAALHSTQETRTMGESVGNVAGAVLLSGVLGGAVGALGAKRFNEISSAVEADMNIPAPDKPDLAEPGSISLSAAAVRDTTLAQETLAGAFGAEKFFSALKLNPKLRLATSPSVEARRYLQEIAETNFYYEKNAEGIENPIALESIIGIQHARLGRSIKGQDEFFKRFKQRIKTEGGDNLSYLDFRKEAAYAMRRNDTHTIPEVQEVARLYRKEIIDPLKDAAIKSKLLPEDVKVSTADSYLHRWWDKEIISARRSELENIIHGKLRTLPEIKTKDGYSLADDELSGIASDIVDRLLGAPEARTPYDLPLAERGPLKERTLNFIRDEEVEEFLVNDIEAVAAKYLRTMSADVAFQAKYGTINIIGKDGVITSKIREDYRALRANAERELSGRKLEKKIKQLNDSEKRDIRDVEAVVNQIRGTYGMPDNPDSIIVRTARATRELQYLSKLGGMTISAFADAARPVMTHGFSRVFGDGIKPLVKNIKSFKAQAQEVKWAGTAWDMVTDGRAQTLAEINNPYVKGTRFEKGLHSLSNSFGKITLMAPWNSALKQFTGVVVQGRIVDGVRSLTSGNIKPKDLRYLSMIGISETNAKKIAAQIEKHGSEVDGVTVVNTQNWTNQEALLAYRTALKKEVDRAIVTPGAGDIPLILKETEAGKMVGQFRSFAFASTNKVLISGLQEIDAQTVNGWALSIALGMMTYAYKTWDRGEELSDDPAVWIQEGVDRSGLLGILSEINQLSSKATRGTISLQALTGAPLLTRYQAANVEGLLLGPTIGTVKDALQTIGAASTGEWTTSDSRALRRMIPYQNLFLARQLFDKMEEGINDSLGIKGK